jgi:hypothetical protein
MAFKVVSAKVTTEFYYKVPAEWEPKDCYADGNETFRYKGDFVAVSVIENGAEISEVEHWGEVENMFQREEESYDKTEGAFLQWILEKYRQKKLKMVDADEKK